MRWTRFGLGAGMAAASVAAAPAEPARAGGRVRRFRGAVDLRRGCAGGARRPARLRHRAGGSRRPRPRPRPAPRSTSARRQVSRRSRAGRGLGRDPADVLAELGRRDAAAPRAAGSEEVRLRHRVPPRACRAPGSGASCSWWARCRASRRRCGRRSRARPGARSPRARRPRACGAPPRARARAPRRAAPRTARATAASCSRRCRRFSERKWSSATVRATWQSQVRAEPRFGSKRCQSRSARSNVSPARSSARNRSPVNQTR